MSFINTEFVQKNLKLVSVAILWAELADCSVDGKIFTCQLYELLT